MTSRSRKISWMRSFGAFELHRAVERAFARNGSAWLTDEQLDEIVRVQLSDLRFTKKLNRENREKAA